MALLVTLFLVLVNIFNSVTANAPKSEGLTAVETWVVMCILHVFCVLSEYAIILKIIQVGVEMQFLICFFAAVLNEEVQSRASKGIQELNTADPLPHPIMPSYAPVRSCPN